MLLAAAAVEGGRNQIADMDMLVSGSRAGGAGKPGGIAKAAGLWNRLFNGHELADSEIEWFFEECVQKYEKFLNGTEDALIDLVGNPFHRLYIKTTEIGMGVRKGAGAPPPEPQLDADSVDPADGDESADEDSVDEESEDGREGKRKQLFNGMFGKSDKVGDAKDTALKLINRVNKALKDGEAVEDDEMPPLDVGAMDLDADDLLEKIGQAAWRNAGGDVRKAGGEFIKAIGGVRRDDGDSAENEDGGLDRERGKAAFRGLVAAYKSGEFDPVAYWNRAVSMLGDSKAKDSIRGSIKMPEDGEDIEERVEQLANKAKDAAQDAKERLQEQFGQRKQAAEEAAAAAKERLEGIFGQAKADAKGRFDGLLSQAEEEAKKAVEAAKERLEGVVDEEAVEAAKERLEWLLDVDAVEAAKDRLAALLKHKKRDAEANAEDAQERLGVDNEAIEAAKERLAEAVEDAKERLEKAKEALADLTGDERAGAAKAIKAAKQRLERVRQGLAEMAGDKKARAVDAVEDLRKRFDGAKEKFGKLFGGKKGQKDDAEEAPADASSDLARRLLSLSR